MIFFLKDVHKDTRYHQTDQGITVSESLWLQFLQKLWYCFGEATNDNLILSIEFIMQVITWLVNLSHQIQLRERASYSY